MDLSLKMKLEIVRELVEYERIVVFDEATSELHSGCAIRSADLNGGAIQIWVEECPCHRSAVRAAEEGVLEPGGTFLPSGRNCSECGCELEEYVVNSKRQ